MGFASAAAAASSEGELPGESREEEEEEAESAESAEEEEEEEEEASPPSEETAVVSDPERVRTLTDMRREGSAGAAVVVEGVLDIAQLPVTLETAPYSAQVGWKWFRKEKRKEKR